MKKCLKDNWILLMIIALAIFFRFWQISSYPGGLFPDEAANGLDINSIFKGEVAPFYEKGNGREAGFFYFLAAAVAMFGRGHWQHHIISAGFGVAAVIAAYFLTKRMFGKNVALMATFFMAVSSYAVTMQRTAFRANTVPLLATLTLLFAVKFFQTDENQPGGKKSKYWSAALSGLFFALGFYTYTSFRMMLPLLFGFAFLLWFGNRSQTRELIKNYAKYKAAFAAAFVIGISWLASYYFQHPKSFVGRAGQVSIFNQELNNGDIIGTFLLVVKKTILSFFTEGDLNWRHNVSGYPFLSPFISVFFAIAVITFTLVFFKFLKQAWDQKIESKTVYMGLMACWFWFMTVPEITTAEGIPHGLRLTGVIPVIFILAAWGVNWVWQKISTGPSSLPRQYFALLFFAVIGIYNFYLYFGVAVGSPYYYYAYRSDLTDVSNYLNERNSRERTYLSLDTFSVQTPDYLTTTTGQPYMLADPARTYQVKLKPGDQVVFSMSTLYDTQKFCEHHPSAKLVTKTVNQFGLISMAVYENTTDRGQLCESVSNPGFNTNPS